MNKLARLWGKFLTWLWSSAVKGALEDGNQYHLAMKQTPSNCSLLQCNYNLINPPENSQECIGCHYLKDENWLPRTEEGERDG